MTTTRRALQELVDVMARLLAAHEKEAGATLTLMTAQENYTDPKPDERAQFKAMLAASEAEKGAYAQLAAARRVLAEPEGEDALTGDDIVGWMVTTTDDITHAAMYPLCKEQESIDAARRWKARRTALVTVIDAARRDPPKEPT